MIPRKRSMLTGITLLGAVGTSTIATGVPAYAARSHGAAPSANPSAYVAPGGVLRTITVGNTPTAIAVDARTSRAFVINSGDSTLSLLDTHGGAVLRTIALETTSVKADNSYVATVDEQTGRVFVVSQHHPPMKGRMITLDARTGDVIGRTTVGLFPLAEAVDERTNRVFVTNLDDNTVSVLDARSGTLLRTIPVGRGPGDVAVEKATRRVFVSNAQSSSLSILDAGAGTVLHTVLLGQIPTGPGALAVDERDGRVFALDQSGHMTVLDAATETAAHSLTLGAGSGAMAVDEQTGRLFVTHTGPNFQGHSVLVLDARRGTRVRTVTVGRGPTALTVDERTGHVFVANYTGNSVSVLDARSGGVLREIPVKSPFALAVDAQVDHVFTVGASNAPPSQHGTVSMLAAR